MLNVFITIDLEEKNEVLINPLIDPSTLLEKANRKIIYNPRLRKYHEVIPKVYLLPVYLPELGILLSLDMVSKELSKRFYEETRDYEGIISKGKIFCCKIHNFQKDINRMVSWGTIRPIYLPNNFLKLYITNLINDFYLTPSISQKGCILSPHRWFFISSIGYHKFKAFLNYNFGILYIEKEKLRQKKIRRIWINSPIKLYEIIGGFISFRPTGFVDIEPVPIHFTEDLVGTDVFIDKGDYFISFLISFNNYLTSYEGANIKSGNINLVETLLELVNSPYEILPFLFPFMARSEDFEKLVYRFSVSKGIFEKIYTRLTKFGTRQNPEMVSFYESIIRKDNRLLNIIENDKFYHVEVVNPGVIPFLLKKFAGKVYTREKYYSEKILKELKILEKIKHLDELLGKKQFFDPEFLPLYGIGRCLTPRAEVLMKYIHILKERLLNQA